MSVEFMRDEVVRRTDGRLLYRAVFMTQGGMVASTVEVPDAAPFSPSEMYAFRVESERCVELHLKHGLVAQ